MARIFYGLSGDGRGHATRVQTVVEMLRPGHRITIYAPLDAHDLLAPRYRDTEVVVRRIPGVRSQYDSDGSLTYVRTVLFGLPRIIRLGDVVDRVRRDMERERPDLVITDFDSILPRAAEQYGVPHLCIDHQHLLVHGDFGDMPPSLQLFARAAGLFVRSVSREPVASIVSSFQGLPLECDSGRVHHVGALLREEIMAAEPRIGRHLLVYFRRAAPPSLLDALSECGLEVRIYGLGGQERRGNLRFCPIDDERFVEDLATCRAVVSTAGNQLVGEALYLGKPVLGIPEPGNREQQINARLLERTGGGEAVRIPDFDEDVLPRFLARLDRYRERIDREAVSGNDDVRDLLDRYLAAIVGERNLPGGAAAGRAESGPPVAAGAG